MGVRIDGKITAQALKAKLAQPIGAFARQRGRVPGLAVVLVGDDPASQVYVGSKKKQTEAIGMRSFETLFPADVSEETLLAEIDRLNAAEHIDGILVQLPLPDHIHVRAVLERIDPLKDVDGFHPVNVGRLVAGADALVACTPFGCSLLLEQVLGRDFSGLNAVVVGRSDIVGKPMAHLLLARNATVSIAHSRTRDLAAMTQQADIVVAAVGQPKMLGAEHIRAGAVVIDVGINRITLEDGSTRLVGDVDTRAVEDTVKAITPVPGGVGPMTIACLLHNTVKAAHMRAGLTFVPVVLD